MEEIKITKASLTDAQTLLTLGRETFYETFAESNTEEDMQKYLTDNFTEEKFHTELTNPDSLFYIAWEGDAAIGYLKVNENNAQTELRDADTLEIERIYVKNAYHGRKVGQLLYDKAVEIAREKGKSAIWLGVWEENPRAIRFYEKNGFIAFGKHSFMLGNDEQTDIMMRKELGGPESIH
jgi:ribosomal protein S18 acetylase RimI-like enzyme